jgi:hypothetical protein
MSPKGASTDFARNLVAWDVIHDSRRWCHLLDRVFEASRRRPLEHSQSWSSDLEILGNLVPENRTKESSPFSLVILGTLRRYTRPLIQYMRVRYVYAYGCEY